MFWILWILGVMVVGCMLSLNVSRVVVDDLFFVVMRYLVVCVVLSLSWRC